MGLGRSAVTPEASQTFGGHKPLKKGNKKISECWCPGMTGTLKNELLAHDNATIIPKGSEIKIVDAAQSLPDIEFDGNIFSVDESKLEEVFKPHDNFENKLSMRLWFIK